MTMGALTYSPSTVTGYAERIVAERVGGQQAGWGA
jgi:hypothetical protein